MALSISQALSNSRSAAPATAVKAIVPVTKALAAIPIALNTGALKSVGSGGSSSSPAPTSSSNQGPAAKAFTAATPASMTSQGLASLGPAQVSSPGTTPMPSPSPAPATSAFPAPDPSFVPTSSAQYNDPNLPAQTAVPDDSANWNDPAPAAVVTSAIQAATTASTTANPATSTALAVPTPALTTDSLWTRILRFLGFLPKLPVAAAATTATVHGDGKSTMTVEQAAQGIVRRVRNGDQNAMGLAVMIGENARKGDPTAQKTFQCMKAFIDRTNGATHAGERALDRSRTNPGWAKAVHIANGPLLHDLKVANVASSFGTEQDTNAFVSGVLLPTYPAVSAAHHHGKVVGMARKIQAVRMPNSRISDYSATVGWELGE